MSSFIVRRGSDRIGGIVRERSSVQEPKAPAIGYHERPLQGIRITGNSSMRNHQQQNRYVAWNMLERSNFGRRVDLI
jgi:hypothetical protein